MVLSSYPQHCELWGVGMLIFSGSAEHLCHLSWLEPKALM